MASDAKPFFYSPRRNAYPPPENGIFDLLTDGGLCIWINPRWVPFINGVLDVLRQQETWSEREDFAIDEIQELELLLQGYQGSLGFCGAFSAIRYLVDDDGVALTDDDGLILIDDDGFVPT